MPDFKKHTTFRKFLDVYLSVKSRTYLKGDKNDRSNIIMVPFGDFLNHSTPANGNWLFGVRDS